MSGKEAQARLEEVGITTNKNMIHGDALKPSECSGLRIGFAAATTRGCTEEQARRIAHLIFNVLKDAISQEEARAEVAKIVSTWKDVMTL